jgi:hypothetical protein
MMPAQGMVFGWAVGDLRVTEAVASCVQQLLDANEDEPLAHVLWREAWDQRHSNPRCSLLLGMTALEVGSSSFISIRVPDAGWLLEEVPSPPTTRMLMEYLPKLPAGDHAKVLVPSLETAKELKKGVELRNKLVHTGRSSFSNETLQTILLSVRDVLWLLDSTRGLAWAASFRSSG